MIPLVKGRELFWPGVRFVLVGALAACVYFFLLYSMVEWFDVPVMIATAVGYLVTMVESYLLHHFWTFKSAQRHSHAFPKFLATNAVGFTINFIIMYTAVEVMGFNYLLSQVVAIAVNVVWNFLAGSRWVFKLSEKRQA